MVAVTTDLSDDRGDGEQVVVVYPDDRGGGRLTPGVQLSKYLSECPQRRVGELLINTAISL